MTLCIMTLGIMTFGMTLGIILGIMTLGIMILEC
jgi:hypothetical protein